MCKTVGGGSKYVGIDFCLSALRSDNRSRSAKGYRDFSSIAVDLLTDNVTSTAVQIDHLLQKGIDAATSGCLRLCQELYIEIVGRLSGCADGVKDGSFELVQVNLWLLASDLKKCEAGFIASHVASPLKVDDNNAFKLAKLADGLLDHATLSS
ncbi:uncharacterized protein [Miscanthus floridulus]|uniref:uncharacterized protein n=1 Tax=Miscanthus floridulus TaxID=154761 RepID=UPI00345AC9A9